MGERPTGETPLVILQCLGVSPMGPSPAAVQPPKNLGKSARVLLSWQSRKDNSDSIPWDSYSPTHADKNLGRFAQDNSDSISWDSHSPIESRTHYSILLLYYRRYVLNAFFSIF